MITALITHELMSAWERSQATFWPNTVTFLSLTLRALGLALLGGIPAGILLTRFSRVAGPVMAVLGMVQTVPSLVLLGLLLPLVGIGQTPALLAAVAYSLFPIVLNTYVGITQVSPAVRDAARGMGMTDGQMLWNVELPLAFPVLLAGIRTGAVYASSIVVLGALIGAGGLGDYIYNGMSRDDNGLIWLGAIPVLLLTLGLFWGLGQAAALARRNSTLGISLGSSLIVILSAYAVFGVAEQMVQSRRADLVVGAKDFTEGQILAEIVKQVIESHTNLSVEVRGNLGTNVILKALKNGDIDLYPEYTGVLLMSKEALDLPVPADRGTITTVVREGMRHQGITVLEPFGLNNTYVLCVRSKTAEKYGLKKISDLLRTSRFRIVVDLSFMTRPDGWEGLVKIYGLKFDRPPQQMSPNLLYKALEQNQVDLVIGFATDWQIQALDLVVLADDRGYFPSYHAVPIIRAGVLKQHPEIGVALAKLRGHITDEAMRQLNYSVTVLKRSDAEVARDFLRKQGLLD